MPKRRTKRQTKRKFLFPAVATTSILVTGGVAYWWLTQQQQLLQETAIGGKFIPQNAYFTVSVSTDLAKWDRLQTYGTPETKAILNTQLASLKKRFLTDSGYDYQRDIQPWIGREVLIGYLPFKNLNRGKEGQFIAVLPIADKLAAQQVLSSKASESERTYRGIKINQQGGWTAAVLEDDIIAATSPEGVEIAIDTFLDNSGIGNNSAFVSAVAQVKNEEQFANLYLNIPSLTDLAIARASKSFPQESLVKERRDEGIFSSMTLEPERIKFEGISWLKLNASPPVAVNNKVTAIPNLLPTTTLLLVSGSNAKSLWEDISFWSNISSIAPVRAKDWEQGLKSTTGLSWQSDLLPWITKEFALSLIPKSETDSSTVGLVLMARASDSLKGSAHSDRAAADRAFSKLDAFVTQKYQLKISQNKVADLPLTTWKSRADNFAATRGFMGQDLAFINLGDDVASQFLPKPQASLVDNPLYRLASDGALTATNGQFYIDLEKTVHPGNLSVPKFIPQQDKFLKAIKAIGLKIGASEEPSYRFELLIVPKKI